MITAIGGRKFVGFIVVAAMLFSLVLLEKITGGEFVAFITANLGIYTAGNVVKAQVDKDLG